MSYFNSTHLHCAKTRSHISYDSLHLRVIGFNDHPPSLLLKNDHDWLCGRSLRGVETFDVGVGGK